MSTTPLTHHTLGPWNHTFYGADRFEVQGAHRRIAIVDTLPNARLIALAPAMLEALREYVEAEERAAPYSSSPLREKARAILAQVDGKE